MICSLGLSSVVIVINTFMCQNNKSRDVKGFRATAAQNNNNNKKTKEFRRTEDK